MALHFSEEELAARRRRACKQMAAEGLDGLLLFRQDSMYYLTGYDTFGYAFFQCLFLGADGRLMLLTRAPDLRQAQETSVIEDVRIWADGADAEPAEELRAILEAFDLRGQRLGVEYDAYGLSAHRGRQLDKAFAEFCVLVDASELITRQRLVKSPAEIAYVRRAAEQADAALEEASALARPGAFEGDILAAMQGAVFRRGGDYPGNEYIIGSGPGALLCRYYAGRRHLEAQDQLTLEWAGAERHYHAAMMRTLVIGEPRRAQLAMHAAARDAQLAVEAELRPGRTIGEAYAAHARVLDEAGYGAHRMNACGYSLGATFGPSWMDWPMLYRDNPVEVAPGMVFFVHIIIFDSQQGLAMTSGRTGLIGEGGFEPLSRTPLDLITT